MKVIPDYGWGWIGLGDATRVEPEPFEISLDYREPGKWSGVICSADHEFFGAVARLSQRHTVWDGVVNVEISTLPNGSRLAAGYGHVEDFETYLAVLIEPTRNNDRA